MAQTLKDTVTEKFETLTQLNGLFGRVETPKKANWKLIIPGTLGVVAFTTGALFFARRRFIKK